MAVHAAVASVQRALQFWQNNRRGARARGGGVLYFVAESHHALLLEAPTMMQVDLL